MYPIMVNGVETGQWHKILNTKCGGLHDMFVRELQQTHYLGNNLLRVKIHAYRETGTAVELSVEEWNGWEDFKSVRFYNAIV